MLKYYTGSLIVNGQSILTRFFAKRDIVIIDNNYDSRGKRDIVLLRNDNVLSLNAVDNNS